MLRKSVIVVLFVALLDFKVVISKSKLRKFESKLNLLQSKLSMLENKVFQDELEFRDTIVLILNQLNNTAHRDTNCKNTSSDSKHTSTEIHRENMETLDIDVKAIQNGFESEKRYIRNQFKIFESVISDMEQQIKKATGEFLEKADNRLFDMEIKISDGESSMNIFREEMGKELVLIKQSISKEFEASSISQKKSKETVDELSQGISENRAILHDSQDKVENIQSAIGNINGALFFKCGSWIRFGMSCYKLFTDIVSWEDAIRNCTFEEAYLVEIGSSAENTFLINHFNITVREEREKIEYEYDIFEFSFYYDVLGILPQKKKLTGPWIGASDKRSEGKWVWEYSQRNLIRTYDSWNDGEPNGGKKENCLNMHELLHYNWNDSPCYLEKPYICEKSVAVE